MPQLTGQGGALLLMVDKRDVFRLPLVKPSSIVGRAAESDLKLDFADVSRKHCRIDKKGDKYVIEDLGSTGGTFVANEGLTERKLTAATPLSDHDIIRIGAHRFHFILTVEPKPEELPQLVPVAGGQTVQLTGAVSTVGRAGASLTLSDPRVSTKHAIIEAFGRHSVYVIDLGSANGTTVNEQKVVEPRRVEEHDVIGFAGIKYRVALASNEAKTMIGVVAAPATKERPAVGTGTLRFDEERQRIIEALANEKQNLQATMSLPGGDTNVGKTPVAPQPVPRPSTGTYTGAASAGAGQGGCAAVAAHTASGAARQAAAKRARVAHRRRRDRARAPVVSVRADGERRVSPERRARCRRRARRCRGASKRCWSSKGSTSTRAT